MAMYLCDNCDSWVDDDWSPMQEHPWRKRLPRYKHKVVCEDCYVELEYELKEALLEDLHEPTEYDEWRDYDEHC